MSLERTFGMIKPDAVANGHVGDILNVIRDNGFRIVGMKMRRIATTGGGGVLRGPQRAAFLSPVW